MATAVIERPHVLHTVKEYNVAVSALRRLLERNPKRGSREFEMLELLSLLVEDYETRNIPEPPLPSPPAVVDFMLKQKGLTRADLKRATTLEKNVTTKIVMAVFFQAQAPEELRDIPGMDRVEMFVSTGLGRLADSFARTLASGSGTSSS